MSSFTWLFRAFGFRSQIQRVSMWSMLPALSLHFLPLKLLESNVLSTFLPQKSTVRQKKVASMSPIRLTQPPSMAQVNTWANSTPSTFTDTKVSPLSLFDRLIPTAHGVTSTESMEKLFLGLSSERLPLNSRLSLVTADKPVTLPTYLIPYGGLCW